MLVAIPAKTSSHFLFLFSFTGTYRFFPPFLFPFTSFFVALGISSTSALSCDSSISLMALLLPVDVDVAASLGESSAFEHPLARRIRDEGSMACSG